MKSEIPPGVKGEIVDVVREIRDVSEKLGIATAQDEMFAQTAVKGFAFEDDVHDCVGRLAAHHGDCHDHNRHAEPWHRHPDAYADRRALEYSGDDRRQRPVGCPDGDHQVGLRQNRDSAGSEELSFNLALTTRASKDLRPESVSSVGPVQLCGAMILSHGQRA